MKEGSPSLKTKKDKWLKLNNMFKNKRSQKKAF